MRRACSALSVTMVWLAICFIVSGSAVAQEFRGAIRGRVTDPSGAAVPGAHVVATKVDTGVITAVETNTEGNYQLPYLQPGQYQVRVEASGFKAFQQPNIDVVISQTVTLDVGLEVGASSETVTVTAEAPLLNTVDGDLGQVVNKRLVDNVAISVNRNAIELTQLAGVTGSVNNGYTSTSQSNISIAGGGGDRGKNEYLIDGIPNTSPIQNGGIAYVPSLDSVDEVKVHTTLFDAAYSHSNGGAISITTRGGTNEFHGSAYGFGRFTALNANTWGNNRTGAAKPNTNYRQWGGIIGGPIWIPKVYNGHNRTFFLFSIERDRDPSQNTTLGRTPTALERQGDFSQTVSLAGSPLQIYNPFSTAVSSSGAVTRQLFENARIPTSLLNPFGAALMNYFPLPNYNTNLPPQIGAFNYLGTSVRMKRQEQWSVRGDHNFGTNNHMFLRLSEMTLNDDSGELFPGNWSWNSLNSLGLSTRGFQSATFDDTHIFSPTFFASFRYGAGRRTDKDLAGGANMDPSFLKLPDAITRNSTVVGLPFIRLRASGTSGGNSDTGEYLPWIGSRFNRDGGVTHSFLTNFTKLHGNHTFKFGTDYRIQQNNYDNRSDSAAGDFSFNPQFTQADPNNANSSRTSGTAMASLLLGVPAGGSFGSRAGTAFTSHYVAGFLQDQWKVTNKLTVTFGLRYEVETPYSERYNHIAYGWDPNLTSPVQVPGLSLRGGFLPAGQNGKPNRAGETDWNNLGPRFSFAWNVVPKTVIRGGYGIFYASDINNIGQNPFILDLFNTQSNYIASVGNTSNSTIPATTISNPFPNGLSPAIGFSQGLATRFGDNLSFVNPNRVLPYTQQAQVSIQRELPFAMVVEGSWLHSLSLKLFNSFNLNEKPDQYLALGTAENNRVANPFYGVAPPTSVLGQSATVSQSQLWGQFPQYASLTVQGMNTDMATYNAVQFRAEKRFTHGLTFTGIYIFSRLTESNISSLINERRYSSISDIDQTHVARFAFSYDLPLQFRHEGARYLVVRQAFGGWRLSGFYSVATGFPIQVTDANGRPWRVGDPNRPGSAHDKLGLGPIDPATGYHTDSYVDPSAFVSLPSRYIVATAPPFYDDLRGPGTNYLNLSAFKAFRLNSEGARVELRMDAQNALNHPNFNAPSLNLSNKATFGQITGAGGNRLLQLGLRFAF